MTVATTIRDQIGPMALRMLGACDLGGDSRSLRFKVKGSPKRVTHVHVELHPSDTYIVSFWTIRGAKMTLRVQVADVYADALRSTITAHTGLYTTF
jgi:hypothetical protein